jgi:hypothetical protein
MHSGSQAGSTSGESMDNQNITISIGKTNGLDGTTGKSVVVMEAPGGGIFLGSFDPKDYKSGSIKLSLDVDPTRKGYVILKKIEPTPEKELSTFQASYNGKKKVISIGMSNGLDNATTGKIVIVEEASGGGKLLIILNPDIDTKLNIGKTNGLFGTQDKVVVNQEASGGGALLAIYPDENLAKELVESMNRIPFVASESNKEGFISTADRNFKKNVTQPNLNNKKNESSPASKQ